MSREFEVTEGMLAARAKDKLAGDGTPRTIFLAMVSHPEFRAQLRAWAAEEMRGLVPESALASSQVYGIPACNGWDACRAETLANIEKWEQGHE